MMLGLVERQGGLFNVAVRCEADLPAASVYRLLHRERDRLFADDEHGGQTEERAGSARGVSRCLHATTTFGDESGVWSDSSGMAGTSHHWRLVKVGAIVVWLMLQDVG